MLSIRIYSLILSTVAGVVTCLLLPTTTVEKATFALTANVLTRSNSLHFGEGTEQKPYALGSIQKQVSPKKSAPTEILLTDDPNQIFQSSPPSPLDLALILHNLKRLNQTSIAIGTPLHWVNPDLMPLQALDRQLDQIPHLITTSPLSRTTAPSPIPPAFRRASLPLSKIHGNHSLVPVVNRTSLPDVVLGNQNALAGFSILDSEPSSKTPHLIAKWNDRVVFSFTFLCTLQHLNIPLDSIQVHMGRHIDLGKDRLYIPIDDFGRLIHLPEIKKSNTSYEVPAENLIDAPDDMFVKLSHQPIVIRNAHSNQEPASLDYSNSLSNSLVVMSEPDNSFAIKQLDRPSILSELLFISAVITLIFSLQSHFPSSKALVYLFGVALGIVLLHFAIVYFTTTWIPTLPSLAALATAGFFCRDKSNKARKKIMQQRRNRKSSIPTAKDLLDPKKNDRI